MKVRTLAAGLLSALFLAASAQAIPTGITIRVLSKGAKFIGTSMGGAKVVVRDAQTGEILDQGVTQGTTGSTEKIMRTPLRYGTPLSDENSAKFTAVIDIAEPTLVEITAYGPLGQPQSINKVSATQWVVPGAGITAGDAWLMRLPGMVVDILAPPAHIALQGTPQNVKLAANVTMM